MSDRFQRRPQRSPPTHLREHDDTVLATNAVRRPGTPRHGSRSPGQWVVDALGSPGVTGVCGQPLDAVCDAGAR